MTFKGSKLGLADISIKDRGLSFRVLFADPDTGRVHAHTTHTVPIAEVPGAGEAITTLIDALEAWGYNCHFGSQPEGSFEQVEIPGIQEQLAEPNRFEQG